MSGLPKFVGDPMMKRNKSITKTAQSDNALCGYTLNLKDLAF